MNTKQYEVYRNELVGLLEEAVEVEGMDEVNRTKLESILRKTMEDQFQIVIVGEFQGGKSTTFDALCDGRELSPRGTGIKTSGCIVMAQNVVASDALEKGVVKWRNQEELVKGFSRLITRKLSLLDDTTFGGKTPSEICKILKLDNPGHRKLLNRAIQMEWKAWEKDKAGYDTENEGFLDMLKIAAIVNHFADSPELDEWRRQSEFKPEEIGKIIVFPEEWESSWEQKDPSRFKIDEVLFAFIKEIRLYLHSKNLSRIGSVIVDCPGLSASQWDTEVARNAMSNADAILYLLDGSKTAKLSDMKELRFIRENNMEHKLFAGCNMRNSAKNSESIFWL